MPPTKPSTSDSDEDEWMTNRSDISDDFVDSTGHLDIFNSLVGPSKKRAPIPVDGVGDDSNSSQAHLNRHGVKALTLSTTSENQKSHGKGNSSGSSFQTMGLHPSLLRALLLNGYQTPTPIQRLAIPSLITSPPRDLVGMARTGSGKTLAYIVPLIQRLGGRHSSTFGARAVVLVPTRELALQIVKVGKELSRGWNKEGVIHAGDARDKRETSSHNLRWSLVVGGDSLDDQFNTIANNPDVIVATPGRLLHLVVEMNLDLRSAHYVVFDEADRLFEMGFATALHEILLRLPSSRQTVLLSATLPETLVEFARAGLQEPKFVRLDSESKISPDLRMAFFSVKETEKDGCLLGLLRDVIKVPFAGKPVKKKTLPSPKTLASHQTIVFTATKHHVEYLHNLLGTAGYAVSFIYGTLDQAARRFQMDTFKHGSTDILVVTDVAARGIDIPVLENVVNYDFPASPKVFVHRVGRTARSGRAGWAWSFVSFSEMPLLLDLQLFLGRELKTVIESGTGDGAFTDALVLGTFDRDRLEQDVEHISVLDLENNALPSLREAMFRGHKLYERTRARASPLSYERAKVMMRTATWGLAGGAGDGIVQHPVLALRNPQGPATAANVPADLEKARLNIMQAVTSFRPHETVFEIGSRGKTAGAVLMQQRRRAMEKATQRKASTISLDIDPSQRVEPTDLGKVEQPLLSSEAPNSFRDESVYMSYEHKNTFSEKGYSLDHGMSFAQNARAAVLNLEMDEPMTKKRKTMKWDRSKKKFVGEGEGADNVKLIRTENGTRLPATYRSGRFEEWKKKTNVRLPRTGEEELGDRDPEAIKGRVYRHNKVTEAKKLDPKELGYERKARALRKREADLTVSSSTRRTKNELKSAEVIRKERKMAERKRMKSSRPKKGRTLARR
ncbi:ATP-dependent RNA helicase dbp10 [Tulasnella sp. 417]|nr:ATP-dependent RNA helicase dbp10 [Tulasnella sp. 417]